MFFGLLTVPPSRRVGALAAVGEEPPTQAHVPPLLTPSHVASLPRLLCLPAAPLSQWRARGASATALGEIEPTSRALISHLSLLFIPAGVGVVRNLDVFVTDGVALSAALVVSTLLTLVTAVAVFRLVSRWQGEARDVE